MAQDKSDGFRKQMEIIFDNIPSGLCVYRVEEERIVPIFHNKAFFDIMGFSKEHKEQLMEEMRFTGVHPQDLPALREKLSALIKNGEILRYTFRVYNDEKQKYMWIQLEGNIRRDEAGNCFLYGLCSDVSVQMKLEEEVIATKEKMENIINAIPGGVAIYKVSDVIETVYFSDGVPMLTGYTPEEYREFMNIDALEMTYGEDSAMVEEKVKEVIKSGGREQFEFRKRHRDGSIVWVRAQIKLEGEIEGCPLIHCVFHNITDLKKTQIEMEHIINSIPGGIAIYHIVGDSTKADFLSDGVIELTGYTRKEYMGQIRQDAMDIIYEADRNRVGKALKAMIASGEVSSISCRVRRKDGKLIWVHINALRMETIAEKVRIYAVFMGMSAETKLYKDIANETADGIYVIDRDNYDVLYANESKKLFINNTDVVGDKCYTALYGRMEPCEFCTLKSHKPDGKEHEVIWEIDGEKRHYSTHFKETDWNGIPAYIKYVHDITETARNREENERLNQYFETLIKNIPSGIAVVKYDEVGRTTPEYMSEKFAEMTGMSLEEAWAVYEDNAMAGVHPDDIDKVNREIARYIAGGEKHCELVYRLRKGKRGYLWVRNTLSMIQNEQGKGRIYAVYHDITKENEEKKNLKKQYKDLIMQHYRTPDPNALVIGHCNITQNYIIEIMDYTESQVIKTLGMVREDFFIRLSEMIPDKTEQQTFRGMFLNKPALEAFQRGKHIRNMKCFLQPTKDDRGYYVDVKMNMIASPDSEDVTGILTIVDVTEKTIADYALQQLSAANYDFVAILDAFDDSYSLLTSKGKAFCVPEAMGSHSERIEYMVKNRIVPRDRQKYEQGLDPVKMMKRLEKENSYSFAISIMDESGDIYTKNMMVSAIDLRLGKICLSRMDITDSVREQRGLLNMLAYTFELAGIIDIRSGVLTLYTRQIVLENLSPHIVQNYEDSLEGLVMFYDMDDRGDGVSQQFSLKTILNRLKEKPTGYDFVIPYHGDVQERYKQVNVLWGDENHHTVCMVRADVTDMLLAERQAKTDLEKALALAEDANRAKSDFLSAMSHDIRTPMNAIMGMTTLAYANLDDKEKVADYLQKISVSSTHLLSLINDILDMSKIEHSKIMLNRERIAIRGLIGQLSAMMEPQAREGVLTLDVKADNIRHEYFYGDNLRINQILINILSNAIKFTPEEGSILLAVEEIEPVRNPEYARYRFTVSDTGVGIQEDFIPHIFDSFSRSSNSRYVKGTGLGLSITKGLVELMQGEISVESRINEGTTFKVEMEFEYMGAEQETSVKGYMEDDEEEGINLGKDKIFAGCQFLIAEDNEINAEIICELLENLGGKCVLGTDGEQILRTYCDAPPETYDAILMDIQMPVMNGYEAARAIRKQEKSDAGKIPIIALTANAFAEDVKAALEAGMNAHVSKPIDIKTMCKVLSKVMDRKV